MQFIVLLSLLGACVSSPLGDIEKEYVKEGMDLKELKADIEELSKEVDEEFSGEQDELNQLRSNLAKFSPDNDTIPVPSINDINSAVAAELFEGDILLTPDQWKVALDLDPTKPLTRRQALTSVTRLWSPMSSPILYYSFAPGLPANAQQAAISAMKYWEARTCATFQQAPAGSTSYILFKNNENGCFSQVGRTGGAQPINLGRGCESMTIAAHELSHAFGTLHVQSRSDRDSFVMIDTSNIQSGTAHNFAKDPSGTLSNYGLPYEFGSMQHYEQFSFAVNSNRPTIIARQPYQQYQYSMESPRATFWDTVLINTMYKCTARCRTKISCQNGGVQDGRDCNKCFCPRGWAGTNCQSRPSDAQNIQVTKSGQRLRIALDGPYRGYEEKLYIIQAPAGRKVQLTVNQIGDVRASRCFSFGMEVVFARDTRTSGFKFCMNPTVVNNITSEGDTLLVHIYRDIQYSFWADVTLNVV